MTDNTDQFFALLLVFCCRNFAHLNYLKRYMKNSNFENFSSLLHTDWHPEKGDFSKENSLKDSAQFNDRLREHNILAISLGIGIVIIFVAAIIFLSL